MSLVSVAACDTYTLEQVRQRITAVLAPLGGIARFVRPGMRVLLKPNLLAATGPEHAVTTHPTVVQAVAELVQQAGGVVWIGDSPAGPSGQYRHVWHKSGMTDVAAHTGATLVPFDGVIWKRLNGRDYLLARPVFDADVVINLPKLKTHTLVLYTGAVKNLFGAIPGTRKRELHLHAPGVREFSQVLVDTLALVRPALTLMDGILGQEGNGPGVGGTPRRYGCLLAATDPVALDTVASRALGYRPGEVLHLALAGDRGLGCSEFDAITLEGDRDVLDFGQVALPRTRWYFNAPSWTGNLVSRMVRVRPRLNEGLCVSCGRCVEACPAGAITLGQRPDFALARCIRCFCCAEVCPQGAITPHRNLFARLLEL
ncbi:MAG: DUF362 domain-containing protein [Anaerolineae bacterium]|nr:DUF362 domain-containing protein [Anaerolineae bacterium]